MGFFLRAEAPADADELDALTRAAFTVNPHSRQTEADIVRQLRKVGDTALSLVEQSGQPDLPGALVGKIIFTPVAVDGGACDWFGLGPLGVLPYRPGAGVGGELVRQGL